LNLQSETPNSKPDPVLPGPLDAWLLAVMRPFNGRLTRVPTQITCKFLKNTPNNVSVGVDRVVYPGSKGCQHKSCAAQTRPGGPFQGRPRSGPRSIAARFRESTTV